LVTKLDVTAHAETASRSRARVGPGSAGGPKACAMLGLNFGAEPAPQPGRFGYFLERGAVLSALLSYAGTYDTMG
jgi:hypothetical protein